MEYTYFNDIDETVFSILRLHRNPFIRKGYLKKIFEINTPIHLLKKGDKITFNKKHDHTITETTIILGDETKQISNKEEYAYTESHTVIVTKVTKDGRVFVKYYNYYEKAFIERLRIKYIKLKYKLLNKFIYFFTEEENYNMLDIKRDVIS